MRGGDVTAVLLTIGEAYTARAAASIAAQKAPAAEVIVVRDTVPFHRALNEGAAQVRTPYFVQVDADMVLDADCLGDLRACMADRVGVVIGHLRDPLLTRVAGIKLFRTGCFASARFPDSISPDTDFGDAMARQDWRTVYAIKPAYGADPAHVFGDHCPDYDALYTFRKFLLQGARHRHRRAAASLRELCRRLRASRHDHALIALIGTAHGIFMQTGSDMLAPFATGADFTRLARLLDRDGATDIALAADQLHALDIPAVLRAGYRFGVELSCRGSAAALGATLYALIDADDTAAWIAMVGICHGLFADVCDEADLQRAIPFLNQVLPRPLRRLDIAPPIVTGR